MFIVSKIKDQKNKNISRKIENKEKFSDLNTFPTKSEEKFALFTNTSNNMSFQTNFSFDSSKGCILNSFIQEQYNSDNIQEITNNKSFLGKKTKFKINYINNEKEIFLIENKLKVKEKKIKKEKIFSLIEEKGANEGRWNDDEHFRFIEAIDKYGNNWKEVQKYVGTRSSNQVRSHAQKFILKLKTFKDDSLGIDLTNNSVKNLNDIIKEIKEIQKDNKSNNILLFINQKLSEKNMKSSENTFNKNIKKRETIKNNNDIKENVDMNIDMNTNIDINNVNQKIDNNKIMMENSINVINNENINNYNYDNLNENKDKNNEEKKNEGDIIKKECVEDEEKNYYFDLDDKNNLNIKYEIFNDVIYEVNKNEYINFPNEYYSKELNTVSIINRGYYC